MATIQMIPPGDGSRNTISVSGRTYSALPQMSVTVPDFDVPVLAANGWQRLPTSAITGGPVETIGAKLRRLRAAARCNNPIESPRSSALWHGHLQLRLEPERRPAMAETYTKQILEPLQVPPRRQGAVEVMEGLHGISLDHRQLLCFLPHIPRIILFILTDTRHQRMPHRIRSKTARLCSASRAAQLYPPPTRTTSLPSMSTNIRSPATLQVVPPVKITG